MGAPQYVTVAGMSVTISHSTPNGCDQFKLIYTLPGALEREIKNCPTMAEARAYAQSLAPRVQAELACTGTLVGEKWRRYQHAEPDLKWLGMPVDEVTAERVAMKKLLGKRPVLPAVKAYVASMPEDYQDMRLVDLKDKFLAEECTEGNRPNYRLYMNQLVRYVSVSERLGVDAMVSQLTTPLLTDFTFQQGGVRTQGHRRAAAVRLLNFGKTVGCVSDGPRSVAERVRSVRKSGKSERVKKRVGVFEPEVVEEFIGLLWSLRNRSPKHMMMLWYVLFAAFAGIRWKELTRMTWAAVELDNKRTYLSAEVTKTKTERSIPISKNLWLFLRMLDHPKDGYVVYPTVVDALRDLAKLHGIRWVHNGFRHSYASYRLGVTKDVSALSLELGNSHTMIMRHYYRAVTSATVQAYWRILPPGYVPPIRKTGSRKRRR